MKHSNDISVISIEHRKPEPLAPLSSSRLRVAVNEGPLRARIENLKSRKGNTSEEEKALKTVTSSHNFKYILGGIGSSDKMWRCEVCGGDVWRMYFQIELLKQVDGKWTSHNCRDLLGHKKCLMMMQKGTRP